MIGLAFSSESEAAELFKKVSLRNKYAAKHSGGAGGSANGATPPPGASASAGSSGSPSKLSSLTSGLGKKRKSLLGGGSSGGGGGAFDKSRIGAPTGFSHVAHMGFDSSSGFTSRNIDPSWERLFEQLESQGISRVRPLRFLPQVQTDTS